jgi:hypothetical protein
VLWRNLAVEVDGISSGTRAQSACTPSLLAAREVEQPFFFPGHILIVNCSASGGGFEVLV